ncbi:TPA: hypothetical protein ACH3X2_007856 [Trebouxia sp. C0005]
MARCSMLRSVLLVVAACSLLTGVSATFVMFGDSFSDDGRGANPVVQDALSNAAFVSGPFPSPPYYKARFSNGRVWIELVAATFGDELENFATGNAISGATGEAAGQFMVQPPYANMSSAHEVFVPSTLDQVQTYLYQHHGVANPANTYVIFIGANDYLNTVNMTASATVSGVVQAINQTMVNLYNGGARQFVVMNLFNLAGAPNLSPPFTPSSMSATAKAEATNFTTAHNAALTQMTSSFMSSQANSTVLNYDTYTFFSNLLANATSLGFTNTMGYCYQGPSFLGSLTGGYNYPLCANPNQYIFWDPVHPTKHVHALLAQDFINAMPQLNRNTML